MSAGLTERSDVKSSARIYPEKARPSGDEGSPNHVGDFSSPPKRRRVVEMTVIGVYAYNLR
ncbi:MAG: hypothetical protein AUJ72_03320 [Candidatus Omnitrophica bacterium CG1_02_46_14]|nr:MAG: hypothetical protein AUJ72_03320 [Candidatus Omnitrophica bacterium CG1_02_46_14]